MSWPPWPNAAPPAILPGLGISPVVNPAPAVLPPGAQYTQEQWAQMQQQNWQQWAQWQQQYQQWHQQYGAEYQKSVNALSQAAQNPTVPNTAVPPPLPKECKPPLPPEEPPLQNVVQPPPIAPTKGYSTGLAVPQLSYNTAASSNQALSYKPAAQTDQVSYKTAPLNQSSYNTLPPNQQPSYNTAPPNQQASYNSASSNQLPSYNTAPPNQQPTYNAPASSQSSYNTPTSNQPSQPYKTGVPNKAPVSNQSTYNSQQSTHPNQPRPYGYNSRSRPPSWQKQNEGNYGNPKAPPSLMSLNLNKPDYNQSQIEKRPFGQPDFHDPKRNKFDEILKPIQNYSNAPPTNVPIETNPALQITDDLSETEKKFIKQFTEWEAQFNKWKDQNMNHPDKNQYREYEKKWEAWRTQLLERREQMRRKRLGLPSSSPHSDIRSPADVIAPKPSTNISQAEGASLLPSFVKPPPTMNNEPLEFKKPSPDAPVNESVPLDATPVTDHVSDGVLQNDEIKDDGSSFLKITSSDGIPGLDLVKDSKDDEKQDDEKVVELEENPESLNKGPDLDAISKGINNILGDQKLLSMLSMVTQNQNRQSSSSVPDNTSKVPLITSLPDNSKDDFISSQENLQQFTKGDDFPRQNEIIPNYADQIRGGFDGDPVQPQNNFARGPNNFNRNYDNANRSSNFDNSGNRFDAPQRFREPYNKFGERSEEFCETDNYMETEEEDPNFSEQNFRGSNDFMGNDNFRASDNNRESANFKGSNNFRGPNNFRETDNFRDPENFREPDSFRGSDNFRGPDNFRRPDNFRGPNNFRGPGNFGGPDNFRGPGNFGGSDNIRGPNNLRGPNNFKAPDTFRGPDNFREPDNFRGPDNFRELDNFRGPDNFREPENFRGPNNLRGGDNFRGPNVARGFTNSGGSGDFERPDNFKGDFSESDNFDASDNRGGPDHFNEPDIFEDDPEDEFKQPERFIEPEDDALDLEEPEHFREPDDFTESNNFRGPNNFREPENFGDPNQFRGHDYRNADDFNSDNFRGPNAARDTFRGSENFRRSDSFRESDYIGRSENFKPVDDFGESDNFNRDQDNFDRGPANFQQRDMFHSNRGGANNFNTGNLKEDDNMNQGMWSNDFGGRWERPDTFNTNPNSQSVNFNKQEKYKRDNDVADIHRRGDIFVPRRNVEDQNVCSTDNDKLEQGGNLNPDKSDFIDPNSNTQNPTVLLPKENEPVNIWKPHTMIDYDHKSIKPVMPEITLEPLRTFDYRHRAVNRIPFPQRPVWLKNTLRNCREFDFIISRPALEPQYSRYPPTESRFSEKRFSESRESRYSDSRFPETRYKEEKENRRSHRDSYKKDDSGDTLRRYDDYGSSYNRRQRDDSDTGKKDFDKYKIRDNFDRYDDDEPHAKKQCDSELRGDSAIADKSMMETKPKAPSITLIEDILNPPGRFSRPARIVIILRGPPGSGKTFLAKLIKDKEVENGGSAPRILSLDDYFMVEQEKEVEEDGRRVKIKEMVYEYEECMEAAYRTSLFKAFKKTVTDGYFSFIVVDNVNDKVKYFGEMWSFAKQNGFQVYITQLELDVQTCTKRNVHGRSEIEIQRLVAGWETTPTHHPILDATGLVQSGSISEVEMEEINSPPSEDVEGQSMEEQACRSKWDNFECSNDNLAKLDGTSKPLRHSGTMEDYLQLEDEWVSRPSSKPGQKRVRWADLEERKEQEKMRAIGFVVGQTNWERMMDPTMGGSALTQTKYFDRTPRYYRN